MLSYTSQTLIGTWRVCKPCFFELLLVWLAGAPARRCLAHRHVVRVDVLSHEIIELVLKVRPPGRKPTLAHHSSINRLVFLRHQVPWKRCRAPLHTTFLLFLALRLALFRHDWPDVDRDAWLVLLREGLRLERLRLAEARLYR